MSKLFNISEATIIAFHSLSMMDSRDLITASEVSSTTHASKNHVLKVLNHLSRHGYITSVRGPRGGYRLSKPPEALNLVEVYELMEGPLVSSACGLSANQCPFKGCIFGDITVHLTRMFEAFLSEKTVKDISRGQWPKKQSPESSRARPGKMA